MKPSHLRLARFFAWTTAVGALAVLAAGYAALPDQVPITRWTTGPKTLPLVLRVPLINLLCLVLVQVLERALSRVHRDSSLRDPAMRVAAILYATVGIKALLEALEWLLLPSVWPWMPALLLGIVGVGLWGTVSAGSPLARKVAPPVPFTGTEKTVAALCVLAIAGLQFLPIWGVWGIRATP
jgi:hypothetical protein